MDASRVSASVAPHVAPLHSGRLELAIAPSTVRVARQWTARQLARPVSSGGHASLEAEVVDAAVLAVSELVTNAVRAVSQAGPANVFLARRFPSVANPVAFAVSSALPEMSAMVAATTPTPMPPSVSLVVSRFADAVRIDVHDTSPLPLPPGDDHGTDDENGRGLTVVAALAERWGWRPEPFGKVVWCELAVTAAHAGPVIGLQAEHQQETGGIIAAAITDVGR